MSEQAVGLFMLALVPLGWAFYLLPTIIAFRRRHPNRWLITAINVFLGATGIGWAGALVWAFNAAHRTEQADGSHGGESGLNLFVNDVQRVSLIGAGTGPAERDAFMNGAPLSASMAVADLERLGRLRGTGHLNEAEFASLKASVLQRVR
ncbi:superinfection immunity protein [Methylobacterium sp. J-090]|uniref:superinfection immunity protein n=1 Tax=Methylobacterium sp. J-090 TaxID=2836666 RepID=UPI001FBC03DE|nr:superinfection immunity protein [Methylobacterium sp. J-090]MCJ2084161.1 superinfection immunity protein [Methylobacterium sp. J-090]